SAVVLAGLLSAVEHIHSCEILHRDVKADNILLASKDGRVLLADFGMAVRATDENIKWTCGSAGHMAPEIIEGEAGSDKMDVFAAGVVLFAAVTLKLPFDALYTSWKFDTVHLEADMDFFSACVPSGGFRCCLLVQLLLRKDPNCRISAAEARRHSWFKLLDKPTCTSNDFPRKGSRDLFPPLQPRGQTAPPDMSLHGLGTTSPAAQPRTWSAQPGENWTARMSGTAARAFHFTRRLRLPGFMTSSFSVLGSNKSMAFRQEQPTSQQQQQQQQQGNASFDDLWPTSAIKESDHKSSNNNHNNKSSKKKKKENNTPWKIQLPGNCELRQSSD
ncbi:unnamed protein product, partial [Polarella glacialis]